MKIFFQVIYENKPEVLESRPQTVPALTEADITSITQKVRQMTGRSFFFFLIIVIFFALFIVLYFCLISYFRNFFSHGF